MNNKGILKLKVRKTNNGVWTDCDDLLVIEEPLEIRLQHGPMASQIQTSISVTMRTPGNDKELALGFLFTEGIIQRHSDVKMVIEEASGPNILLVILKEDVEPLLPQNRNFYATSSCGVCSGKASIEAITTVSVFSPVQDDIVIDKSLFFSLQKELSGHQSLFQSTGGIHASALFDLEGRLIDVSEDVGRHNALDKLIGSSFANNNLPLFGPYTFAYAEERVLSWYKKPTWPE